MGRQWNETFQIECDRCHETSESFFYDDEQAAQQYLHIPQQKDGRRIITREMWYCLQCAYELKLLKEPYDRPPKKGTPERVIYDLTMSTLMDYAESQIDSHKRMMKALEEPGQIDYLFKRPEER